MRYPEILSIRSEPVITSYTDKDTILYALSLGLGANPLDSDELSFVYEKGLRTAPTMSAIIARGAEKILVEGEVDLTMLLHGEQRLRVHRPLPPEGCVATRARCLGVVDKGRDKGALLNIECAVSDAHGGEPYSTSVLTLFCRGDGGFGGPSEGALLSHALPARPHDREVALKTRPDQAALYRLNGDRNPLHIDPDAAAAAGFDRPILHGLCTYGIACRAVMQACCDFDPARIKAFDARFSAPLYPGETLLTRFWEDDSVISFECSVAERGVIVLNNGYCELTE